jgi:hypothetical protein
MRGAWKRLFAAAVVLPLALLAVSGATYSAMACAARGIVVSDCCCPGSAPSDSPSAVVGGAACCTVVQLSIEPAPFVPSRDHADSAPSPQWTKVPRADVVVVPPSPQSVYRYLLSREPPPTGGRHLLLRKRSFLI